MSIRMQVNIVRNWEKLNMKMVNFKASDTHTHTIKKKKKKDGTD